ncbi:MAG: DNA-directed RNA polymerase subunit omega [Pseudomonadota bacterium]|nr:DNA-directed RNA polymerase subunit omega [Pseudomonadota bacterium]
MARVSIEDCLTRIDNKFVLVAVAAHRARQLLTGEEATVRSKNKEAVTALREIAEGRVITQPAPQPDASANGEAPAD